VAARGIRSSFADLEMGRDQQWEESNDVLRSAAPLDKGDVVNNCLQFQTDESKR
jgi:hypothetical protein